MKVIITRSTFVRGEAFEAGPEPVELESGDAKTLIGMNKAVAYVEPSTPPPAPPRKDGGEGGSQPDDLTVIEGVGPATAALLVEKGITTFALLREAEDLSFLTAKTRQAIEVYLESEV